MSRLKMITQTDPKPRNVGGVQIKTLPRVYFAAHPKDYKACRETVAKEVFRTHNCAFCYDSQPEIPYDEITLQDLENMNLFVIPISTQLLTDPVQRRVLEVDLPFAEAHNIPVLPLMQENDLDDLYGKVAQLKPRQALNKHAQDLTALAYEDKLKNFLDSVLLGQAQIQTIREAFAARIFLSYRKKDRALARALMHTVHQDPALRDVAIWYDEFLTFGENFNEEISRMIGESHLFVLAVTSNLMEAGNYVIKYEYPAALEKKKIVLPIQVQAKQPVRRAFRQTFLTSDEEKERAKIKELVRDMVDAADTDSVCSAVKESLEALGKTLIENHDPKHEYLIGMAYLNGVEVEVDQPRAVTLLERSANGGYPAAMVELMRMYTVGRGVKKNLETALYWQYRLADWYRHEYEQTGQVSMQEASLDIQDVMVHTLYQMKTPEYLKEADALCARLLEDRKKLYTPEEKPKPFAKLYMHWSVVLFDRGRQHHACAMEYLKESLRLEQQVYLAAGASAADQHALLERYATGAVCCMKHQYNTTALELLQQGQDLYGDAWETQDDGAFLRTKAAMLGHRGNITNNLSDLRQGLALLQQLEQHKADPKSLYWLSAISLTIAECIFQEKPDPAKRLSEIDDHLRQAEKYARAWLEEQESAEALDHLCLVLCTQIKLYWGMQSHAQACLQEAYQRLELAVSDCRIGPLHHLALAYRVLGQKWEDLGDAADGKERYREAQKHYQQAESYYKDSLSILQFRPAVEPGHVINHSELCCCLGMIYAKQGKDEPAQKHFKKSRRLIEEAVAPFRASAEDWRVFFASGAGEQMMDSYTNRCRDEAAWWVERYESKRYDPTCSNEAKALLNKGLEWAEDWKQAAPGYKAYWRIIALYVLQERLSWATEEYELGYRCNESILHYCSLLGKQDQSFERQLTELRAKCSMGRQSIMIKTLFGRNTQTPAYIHFGQGEKLAKGILAKQETPEVRTLLYTCQFFQASFILDAKKRLKLVRQVWEDVRKLYHQSPSAEVEHLLQEVSRTVNRI